MEGGVMKCEDCEKRTGYTLGNDECGAGSYFEYCTAGHWEGGGPDSQEEYERQINMPDPWWDCPNYEKKEGV